MSKPKRTPQTQKEFIDYRFSETNDNIQGVKDDVKKISDKLDTAYATKDYVDAKDLEQQKQIDSLLDDRKWLVRLLLGFVLLGIITAVVKFKVGN